MKDLNKVQDILIGKTVEDFKLEAEKEIPLKLDI